MNCTSSLTVSGALFESAKHCHEIDVYSLAADRTIRDNGDIREMRYLLSLTTLDEFFEEETRQNSHHFKPLKCLTQTRKVGLIEGRNREKHVSITRKPETTAEI